MKGTLLHLILCPLVDRLKRRDQRLTPISRTTLRRSESIQHKPCSQTEAGDEAVHGGIAVIGRPGVGEIQEAFFLLAGEMVGQPVLVFADRPQLALDARVILESAVLRFVLP